MSSFERVYIKLYYYCVSIGANYIILTYREIIIIIICRNRHSFKRGWIPHKRETLMVCNLHFPTGTTYFNFFYNFWNRRAFQERKPYQFPGWMKNSPYDCPGRGANPRPPAHPDFITSKESHTLLVRPWGGGDINESIIYVELTTYQQHQI